MSPGDGEELRGRREALEWLLATLRFWLAQRRDASGSASPPSPPGAWKILERLAFVHSLEPLLHTLVAQRRLPGPIPGPLRARWEAAYYQNHVFNSEQLAVVGGIVAAAERRGARPLVIKGPAAVARIYRDPGLRVMADVDLLVEPRDLPAVAAASRAAGYRSVRQNAVYHFQLHNPELGATLEVHHDLYDLIARRGSFRRRLRETAERRRVGEAELPVPSPAGSLAVDLAHLLNHDLEVSLKHLLDVAAALDAGTAGGAPGGLWGQVTELLELADLRSELGLVAAAVAELFELGTCAVPAEIRGNLGAGELAREWRPFLAQIDLHGRRRALGEARSRAGVVPRLVYGLRLLFPSPRRLQALHGDRSALLALRHWPGHLEETLRRGWGKLRAGAAAPSSLARISLKGRVFRRRRRQGPVGSGRG